MEEQLATIITQLSEILRVLRIATTVIVVEGALVIMYMVEMKRELKK